jgi:roadblock/LC7 domain-containing protein
MGNLLSQLTEGGVTGLLKGVGSAAKDIREAVTGKSILTSDDRLKILQLTQEMETAALNADVSVANSQMEINKVEAAATSFFKSGWRPATGWICNLGLLYQLIIRPLVPWICDTCGYQVAQLPSLDMTALLSLLGGILGLGGFRTFEKVRGLK